MKKPWFRRLLMLFILALSMLSLLALSMWLILGISAGHHSTTAWDDGDKEDGPYIHDKYNETCVSDAQCQEYMKCLGDLCTCEAGYSFSHPFASCEQSKRIFRQFTIDGPVMVSLRSGTALNFSAKLLPPWDLDDTEWFYKWSIIDGNDNAKFDAMNESILEFKELKAGFIHFDLSISNDEFEGHLTHNFSIVDGPLPLIASKKMKPSYGTTPKAPISKIDFPDHHDRPIVYGLNVTVILPADKFVILEPSYIKNVGRFRWEPFEDVPASMLIFSDVDSQRLLLAHLVVGRFLFKLTGFDGWGESTSALFEVDIQKGPDADNSINLQMSREAGRTFVHAEQTSLLLEMEEVLRQRFDAHFELNVTKIEYEVATEILSLQLFYKCTPAEDKRFIKKPLNVESLDVVDALRNNTTIVEKFRIVAIEPEACTFSANSCACDAFWMRNIFGIFHDNAEQDCSWPVIYSWLSIVVALVILSKICHSFWRFQEGIDRRRLNLAQNFGCISQIGISTIHKGRFSPIKMLRKRKQADSSVARALNIVDANSDALTADKLLYGDETDGDHEGDSCSSSADDDWN